MAKVNNPRASIESKPTSSRLFANEGSSQNLSEAELSMIEHNLSLTPEERLHNHERALQMMLELRRAGEESQVENKS
jgi:hypothetical protein